MPSGVIDGNKTMKLINHNKNNTYDIDTYVMHGTIKMTLKEWEKVYKLLERKYNNAVKYCKTATRDGLCGCMDKIYANNPFSIGVTATSLLAKKFHLKGYKDQNYGIQII